MVFLSQGYTVVPISPSQVLQSTDFGVVTTIGNTELQINFRWNSIYKYYTVDVISSNNQRLLRFYTVANEMHLIRNFDLESLIAPDLKIGIAEHGDDEVSVTPETLGDRHVLTAMRGREVNL